jgi:hypothetical protein
MNNEEFHLENIIFGIKCINPRTLGKPKSFQTDQTAAAEIHSAKLSFNCKDFAQN